MADVSHRHCRFYDQARSKSQQYTTELMFGCEFHKICLFTMADLKRACRWRQPAETSEKRLRMEELCASPEPSEYPFITSPAPETSLCPLPGRTTRDTVQGSGAYFGLPHPKPVPKSRGKRKVCAITSSIHCSPYFRACDPAVDYRTRRIHERSLRGTLFRTRQVAATMANVAELTELASGKRHRA